MVDSVRGGTCEPRSVKKADSYQLIVGERRIHVTCLIVGAILGTQAIPSATLALAAAPGRESMRMGAPDPSVDDPKAALFAKAARHWSFQPLRERPVP